MLTQSGLPIIYSGDEVGQVNDYSYQDDPERAEDSRYIHRGKFPWNLVDEIDDPATVSHRIFESLSDLEDIRREEQVFNADAEVEVVDYSDPAILWIRAPCGRRDAARGL